MSMQVLNMKGNFFALFLYSQYLYLIKFIYLKFSVIFILLNETSIIEHFFITVAWCNVF